MTNNEITELEQLLRTSFSAAGTAGPTPELVALWAEALHDFTFESIKEALHEHVRRSRAHPHPSDVVKILREKFIDEVTQDMQRKMVSLIPELIAGGGLDFKIVPFREGGE